MTWPKYTTYIDIIDGVFVGNNHPIDARMTVEQLTDLTSLETYNKTYEGLMVWVESEYTYYTYYTSEWHRTPVIFGTADTGSTAYFDGTNWSLTFPTTGTLPDETLDYATGCTVIYESDEFATNNVAYICVGGASGARAWKAITA